MRQIIVFLMGAMLCGCSTVQMADYINPDHPYTRRFAVAAKDAQEAVKDVLKANGWTITQEASPTIYERRSENENLASEDVIYFTDIRQSPWIVYSTYQHLNVVVRAMPDGTEIEVRFASTKTILFKQFRKTRNDQLANRLLDRIQARLENE